MDNPSSLIFLVLMVAVFYFLLIRPQQRRLKQHQSLVHSLEPGDRIVTIGGIHGVVTKVEDATLSVEIAPNTTVTLSRQAIGRKVEPETEDSEQEQPSQS